MRFIAFQHQASRMQNPESGSFTAFKHQALRKQNPEMDGRCEGSAIYTRLEDCVGLEFPNAQICEKCTSVSPCRLRPKNSCAQPSSFWPDVSTISPSSIPGVNLNRLTLYAMAPIGWMTAAVPVPKHAYSSLRSNAAFTSRNGSIRSVTLTQRHNLMLNESFTRSSSWYHSKR